MKIPASASAEGPRPRPVDACQRLQETVLVVDDEIAVFFKRAIQVDCCGSKRPLNPWSQTTMSNG